MLSIPLFRNKTYRFLMFFLFLLAFIFLFINRAAGFIMMMAVAIAIVGAYTSAAQRATLVQAGNDGFGLSKIIMGGSQSLGGLVYLVGFISAVS